MEKLLEGDPALRKVMEASLPFGDVSVLLFKVFDPYFEQAAAGLKVGFEKVVAQVNELRAVLAKTMPTFNSSARSGGSGRSD